ncbi:MAG: hypothetical protein WBA51_00680 [Erythrobacter sp.]
MAGLTGLALVRSFKLLAAIAWLAAPFGVASQSLAPSSDAEVAQLVAEEVSRHPAVEAGQGAAVGTDHFYAIVNYAIGRYDRATGAVVNQWRGQRGGPFVHLNSCKLRDEALTCAHSNFPALPMASSIERFDPVSLEHIGSHALGAVAGSLTWLDRHDGSNWAGFAEYDEKGGTPGRDHRWGQIVRYDDDWRRVGGYILPDSVLSRMAPHSTSGGAFGPDGLLYLSGHDRPELYALRLPKVGSVLEHVATIAVPFEGQAFAFAPDVGDRLVYGISRPNRSVVSVRLPRIDLN